MMRFRSRNSRDFPGSGIWMMFKLLQSDSPASKASASKNTMSDHDRYFYSLLRNHAASKAFVATQNLPDGARDPINPLL